MSDLSTVLDAARKWAAHKEAGGYGDEADMVSAAITALEGREPDPQPVHLYLTGDTDTPNIFGVIYDEEDEALEAGHENCMAVFRVPFLPQLDKAVCIHDAEEEDEDDE